MAKVLQLPPTRWTKYDREEIKSRSPARNVEKNRGHNSPRESIQKMEARGADSPSGLDRRLDEMYGHRLGNSQKKKVPERRLGEDSNSASSPHIERLLDGVNKAYEQRKRVQDNRSDSRRCVSPVCVDGKRARAVDGGTGSTTGHCVRHARSDQAGAKAEKAQKAQKTLKTDQDKATEYVRKAENSHVVEKDKLSEKRGKAEAQNVVAEKSPKIVKLKVDREKMSEITAKEDAARIAAERRTWEAKRSKAAEGEAARVKSKEDAAAKLVTEKEAAREVKRVKASEGRRVPIQQLLQQQKSMRGIRGTDDADDMWRELSKTRKQLSQFQNVQGTDSKVLSPRVTAGGSHESVFSKLSNQISAPRSSVQGQDGPEQDAVKESVAKVSFQLSTIDFPTQPEEEDAAAYGGKESVFTKLIKKDDMKRDLKKAQDIQHKAGRTLTELASGESSGEGSPTVPAVQLRRSVRGRSKSAPRACTASTAAGSWGDLNTGLAQRILKASGHCTRTPEDDLPAKGSKLTQRILNAGACDVSPWLRRATSPPTERSACASTPNEQTCTTRSQILSPKRHLPPYEWCSLPAELSQSSPAAKKGPDKDRGPDKADHVLCNREAERASAITRAKELQNQKKEAKAARKAARAEKREAKKEEDVQTQIDSDNSSWNEFETIPGIISLESIPFPPPDVLTCAWDSSMRETWFKTLARRWHPDKFDARFGSRLEPMQKEEILRKVRATFQLANEARMMFAL